MRKKTAFLNLYDKGFTLIELIVVFSVIAIISTIGVAAFVGYSKTQTLNQAAYDLSTTLNTAKSKASSQVKPSVSQCNGSNVLNGYSVTLNLIANPNSYSLVVVCSGGPSTISTTPLPPGTAFNNGSGTPPTTIPGSPPTVFFPIFTSAVTGTGNIVISGFSQTKTISINSSGVIQWEIIKDKV